MLRVPGVGPAIQGGRTIERLQSRQRRPRLLHPGGCGSWRGVWVCSTDAGFVGYPLLSLGIGGLWRDSLGVSNGELQTLMPTRRGYVRGNRFDQVANRIAGTVGVGGVTCRKADSVEIGERRAVRLR